MPNAAAGSLVRFYESLRLTAYFDEAGVPTIGWGTTHGITAKDVRSKLTITPVQAEEWFQRDMAASEREVLSVLKRSANDNQMGAFISFVYNLGLPAFSTSSILKFHNLGNLLGAKLSFALWNKLRDKKTGQLRDSNGLTARRAKEADLYATPMKVPQ